MREHGVPGIPMNSKRVQKHKKLACKKLKKKSFKCIICKYKKKYVDKMKIICF